ncbi:OLC1v1033781C1 [Oldenlandia corymbosa var. corymbosa]|uniref:OLC1v1033781C1 n=1 Tax=Oldenlandia corymbosa var. corymbosa TaxID=529605 RepID=A0AAV1CS03_OLDCO|nr:OLC1v1033781C1 [Oldenlandia corymbosa var. corymbosa]
MNFKKKLFGGRRPCIQDLFGEDEDIPNLEEDVVIIQEGPIPKVLIHDKVEEHLAKRWRNVIVVKLMGNSIILGQLQYRLEKMWPNTQGFVVADIERDYFSVTFVSLEDVSMVLSKGPWLIGDWYIYTQKWDSTFDAKVHKVRFLIVWARLPGMPLHYYNKSFLSRIGHVLRKVIHIDHQTEAKTHGKFARLAVELDGGTFLAGLCLRSTNVATFYGLRRHLIEIANYPICKNEEEDVVYAIRDCPHAREVWSKLVPNNLQFNFFNCSLLDWMMRNLQNVGGIPGSWPVVFGVVAWKIWCWRDETVFKGVNHRIDRRMGEIAHKVRGIEEAVQHKRIMGSSKVVKMTRMLSWKPPPMDWLKLNSDGEINGDTGMASAGGVIRDSNGIWKGGFLMNIGFYSVIGAELWGLFQGLNLTWESGYKKIEAEVDNQSIVVMIFKENRPTCAHEGLVKAIKELLSRNWNVKLYYNHRECNFVVDYLAFLAATNPGGFTRLDLPPPGVRW